jgi:hypothetical protein
MTCWKAFREGDESKIPLIIKDSWQYPEREEGKLLREATIQVLDLALGLVLPVSLSGFSGSVTRKKD